MFSVRSLARVAPRVASRNFVTSTRRSLLSVPRQTISRPQLSCTSFKSFSTSRARCDGAGQELAAKLEQELQIENEDNNAAATPSEENVKTFLDSHDWQLDDKEGEQGVKLSRKYDDEHIEVQFSVADFPPPYGEEDEIDDALLDEEDIETQSGGGNSKAAAPSGRTSGGNTKMRQSGDVSPGDRDELRDSEDDSAGSQPPFPAGVSVTIRRDNKPGVLRFELVAEDGEFSVQSITPFPSAEASEEATTNAAKYWVGPPFEQLDEELQGFFENYLSERGIDSALAMIVPDYIDSKEQKEYLAWLKKVKEFVD